MSEDVSKDDPVTLPERNGEQGLAKPVIRKRRFNGWPLLLVWLVPVGAAVLAGLYYAEWKSKHGPEVVVVFETGEGIKPGQTAVMCHGVQIGEVTTVTLATDELHARIGIRLRREDADFGSEGAKYWVVKPELSGAELRGLGTVVSGNYIEATSGAGKAAKEFAGFGQEPTEDGGMKIVLEGAKTEHLSAESPVYYRGVQVGKVTTVNLSDDATHVEAGVTIEEKYRNLVRTNTVFWNSTGAAVKGSVLTGLQVKVDSLKSLIAGGISFASPDDPVGALATEGGHFELQEESKKEWEKWSPRLAIGK